MGVVVGVVVITVVEGASGFSKCQKMTGKMTHFDVYDVLH
jgi:hypothetical protein